MSSSFLPVFLDVSDLKVLFVGAGTAAVAKWPALLAVGARLTVVAPEMNPKLMGLLDQVTWVQRAFHDSDLEGAVLVYAFTNDAELNGHIAAACRARRIWHNTSGNRGPGAFTSPAVARHEHLTLAVGSSGQSPAQAVAWRDKFATLWTGGQEGP